MKGLKNLKIGAVGARPAAFNTVRYSERILETNGISIEPIDLSEIFGRINRMKDHDDAAAGQLAAIKSYVSTIGIPDAALRNMGETGRSDRRLDEADQQHHQRSAMLDLDGRVLSVSCPAPS